MDTTEERKEVTQEQAAAIARPFGPKQQTYLDAPTGHEWGLRVPSLADESEMFRLAFALTGSIAAASLARGSLAAWGLMARLGVLLTAGPDELGRVEPILGGQRYFLHQSIYSDPEKEDELRRVDEALRALIRNFRPIRA